MKIVGYVMLALITVSVLSGTAVATKSGKIAAASSFGQGNSAVSAGSSVYNGNHHVSSDAYANALGKARVGSATDAKWNGNQASAISGATGNNAKSASTSDADKNGAMAKAGSSSTGGNTGARVDVAGYGGKVIAVTNAATMGDCGSVAAGVVVSMPNFKKC